MLRARAALCLFVTGALSVLACNRTEPAAKNPDLPGDTTLTPASRPTERRIFPSPAPVAAPETASPNASEPLAQPWNEQTAPQAGPDAPRAPDVVYVPTPQPLVDKMLELARIKKTDLVYDLGCGDGRIVVTAAKKYGVRAVGFDVDPKRIAEAKENVAKNGVGDLVTIEQKDIFTLDLSPADVVTLYLLPELNVKLLPQLKKLKPGSRVVSHDYDIAGVTPVKHLSMKPTSTDRDHDIYLWIAPLAQR